MGAPEYTDENDTDAGTHLGVSETACCSIAVPVTELQKLEQARVELYNFLEDKLNEQQMLGLVSITGQVWRVANTKRWDKQ